MKLRKKKIFALFGVQRRSCLGFLIKNFPLCWTHTNRNGFHRKKMLKIDKNSQCCCQLRQLRVWGGNKNCSQGEPCEKQINGKMKKKKKKKTSIWTITLDGYIRRKFVIYLSTKAKKKNESFIPSLLRFIMMMPCHHTVNRRKTMKKKK